ncbi:Protein of unknown function [Gryllus bimaculatus]|nr:Protein of unknown function [Gryllus bimaculatus]
MALGSQVESAAENGINGMEKHASRSGKSDDSSCSFGKKGSFRAESLDKLCMEDAPEEFSGLLQIGRLSAFS